MKIFLSHCSINKRNVKAIVEYLPVNIQTWIDEKDLVWGDSLNESFENVIKTGVDYVVVFLSDTTDNTWVFKELNWAKEHEKEIGRTFVLPVIFPCGSRNPLDTFPQIGEMKYIMLHGYDDNSFKACAEEISINLFALLCRDLDRLQQPRKTNVVQAISQADSVIKEVRDKIYNIIFPYRMSKPITVENVYKLLVPELDTKISYEEFLNIIEKIAPQMSGVYYDGYILYIIEEHSSWKGQIAKQKKEAVARAAAMQIRSGQKIYIDAGSTTADIISIICKRIESHTLNSIQLVLNSTEHASRVINTCSNLGYDEYTTPIKVYIPGGTVRPNTKTIVGLNGATELENIIQTIGKFDLAFVGANATTLESGICTYDTVEVAFKKAAIENTKKIIFALDDTKCGILSDYMLASYEDDICVYINENPNNSELLKIVEKYPTKVNLVKYDE